MWPLPSARWSPGPAWEATGSWAWVSACRARSTATAASASTPPTGTGTTYRCSDCARHIVHPLYLDNPLRACTIAELWFGAARGRGDAVVVNLGTGVGAGLALGARTAPGRQQQRRGVGHTTLVLDGRPCHCGNRGCVETYVGAPGIMTNLRELSPHSPLLHPEDQTATIEALAHGVTAGDPVALEVLRTTARYLGAGIADLVNLLNPEWSCSAAGSRPHSVRRC